MLAFRILSLLTVNRCGSQTRKKFGFRYVLDLCPWAQCRQPEMLAIEFLKFLPIAVKPRLHYLNHQLKLIVGGTLRTFPPIATLEPNVFPCVQVIDWSFAVHQQN
jgi:hypothetical protein